MPFGSGVGNQASHWPPAPRGHHKAQDGRRGEETTTHLYVEADLAMKEAALRRVDDPGIKPVTFKASDRLLAFLEAL